MHVQEPDNVRVSVLLHSKYENLLKRVNLELQSCDWIWDKDEKKCACLVLPFSRRASRTGPNAGGCALISFCHLEGDWNTIGRKQVALSIVSTV
jgi:hypothetical protein